MGRICRTHFDRKFCYFGHPSSTLKEESIFKFPSTKTKEGRDEYQRWLQALSSRYHRIDEKKT